MQRAISQKHYQSISIAPLQNKFRTKIAIAPLQNKFFTKFVVHSIGKRYNPNEKFDSAGWQA
ncbi:MAG TPA: hypothetical protein DCM38_04515 [Gammaproteobacteria bacterium]|nr:hypothetical protein [Gammaproteobacteria bacterium]